MPSHSGLLESRMHLRNQHGVIRALIRSAQAILPQTLVHCAEVLEYQIEDPSFSIDSLQKDLRDLECACLCIISAATAQLVIRSTPMGNAPEDVELFAVNSLRPVLRFRYHDMTQGAGSFLSLHYSSRGCVGAAVLFQCAPLLGGDLKTENNGHLIWRLRNDAQLGKFTMKISSVDYPDAFDECCIEVTNDTENVPPIESNVNESDKVAEIMKSPVVASMGMEGKGFSIIQAKGSVKHTSSQQGGDVRSLTVAQTKIIENDANKTHAGLNLTVIRLKDLSPLLCQTFNTHVPPPSTSSGLASAAQALSEALNSQQEHHDDVLIFITSQYEWARYLACPALFEALSRFNIPIKLPSSWSLTAKLPALCALSHRNFSVKVPQDTQQGDASKAAILEVVTCHDDNADVWFPFAYRTAKDMNWTWWETESSKDNISLSLVKRTLLCYPDTECDKNVPPPPLQSMPLLCLLATGSLDVIKEASMTDPVASEMNRRLSRLIMRLISFYPETTPQVAAVMLPTFTRLLQGPCMDDALNCLQLIIQHHNLILNPNVLNLFHEDNWCLKAAVLAAISDITKRPESGQPAAMGLKEWEGYQRKLHLAQYASAILPLIGGIDVLMHMMDHRDKLTTQAQAAGLHAICNMLRLNTSTVKVHFSYLDKNDVVIDICTRGLLLTQPQAFTPITGHVENDSSFTMGSVVLCECSSVAKALAVETWEKIQAAGAAAIVTPMMLFNADEESGKDMMSVLSFVQDVESIDVPIVALDIVHFTALKKALLENDAKPKKTAGGVSKSKFLFRWGNAPSEITEDEARRITVVINSAENIYQSVHSGHHTIKAIAAQHPELSGMCCHVERLIGCKRYEPRGGGGVRILSIDGGGVRGLVALEIIREITRIAGKPVHELFDFVVGTSTGALLAYALAKQNMDLDDCEKIYKSFAESVFQKDWSSTLKLARGAIYDVRVLEKLLAEHIQCTDLLDLQSDGPCVALVSTKMSVYPASPFIWRSYVFPHNALPKLQGSSDGKAWQALRASTAAPTFFEPMIFGGNKFCDGGVTCNNPTGVALSEVKTLFPDHKIHCVVSIGTGASFPIIAESSSVGLWTDMTTQWKEIVTTLGDSATNVDRIDEVLEALLPHDVYFRFQPLGPEVCIGLDATNPQQLETMQQATRKYLLKNASKFDALATLLQPQQ